MKMIVQDSIQSRYIDHLIKMQSPVSIFLKNSIRLKGKLVAKGNNIIFLKNEFGMIQMVYTHNVTTVAQDIPFAQF